MVLYMHIILFCICLNFGLGIAHIPDTPLTIPDAATASTDGCQRDMWVQGLLVRIPISGHALSNGISVQYVPATDSQGNPVISDFTTLSNDLGGTADDGTIWDPIVNTLEMGAQSLETIKDVALGGYVLNVLDSITFSCDVDPTSPTYGQAIDSEVMTYVKAGLTIIFGFMLFLLIFYIITGKGFGL